MHGMVKLLRSLSLGCNLFCRITVHPLVNITASWFLIFLFFQKDLFRELCIGGHLLKFIHKRNVDVHLHEYIQKFGKLMIRHLLLQSPRERDGWNIWLWIYLFLLRFHHLFLSFLLIDRWLLFHLLQFRVLLCNLL